MSKPKALVFSGYGLNSEDETAYAFRRAGAHADIVHINDLADGSVRLRQYQIVAFPGGFSYGDDTGSGNAFAHKLKTNMWDHIRSFVDRDTLIIGICNGFQILVCLGLVPASDRQYGTSQVSLLHNDSARYTARWVDVKVGGRSPWLADQTIMSLPIAHGEGKLYADAATLSEMKRKQVIALHYIAGDMCSFQDLPANPNGSVEDIAGITDETGRVLGLMPHPERAMFFTQLPHWTYLREQLLRSGKRVPEDGPGIAVFRNAVRYFS